MVLISSRTPKSESRYGWNEMLFSTSNKRNKKPMKQEQNNAPYPLEGLSHKELIFQNTESKGDPIGHSCATNNHAQILPPLMNFHPTSIAYHTHSLHCRNRCTNPLSHTHLTLSLPWKNKTPNLNLLFKQRLILPQPIIKHSIIHKKSLETRTIHPRTSKNFAFTWTHQIIYDAKLIILKSRCSVKTKFRASLLLFGPTISHT